MKIYTRTGDKGDTGLFGGGRVPKDHPRVHGYGQVDELNACLGRAIGSLRVTASKERLGRIQHDLFAVGAHLAVSPSGAGRKSPELPPLPEARIGEMEAWMDEAEARLPALRAFILPGGAEGAGELHVCRTVCRRAERSLVPLRPAEDESVAFSVRYLNRLSDLLFVMARLENLEAGISDIEWEKE